MFNNQIGGSTKDTQNIGSAASFLTRHQKMEDT
jgi:hypothetical protein